MTHASPDWLTQFVSVYQQLNRDTLDQLAAIYHPQVRFVDPFHQIDGLQSLHDYFENLYQNLSFCQFQIEHSFVDQDEVALYWQMRYAHRKLNHGNTVTVDGHSRLKAEQGLVIYHRDYLDAGAMLYEQIPLLGSAIRLLKRRI